MFIHKIHKLKNITMLNVLSQGALIFNNKIHNLFYLTQCHKCKLKHENLNSVWLNMLFKHSVFNSTVYENNFIICQ